LGFLSVVFDADVDGNFATESATIRLTLGGMFLRQFSSSNALASAEWRAHADHRDCTGGALKPDVAKLFLTVTQRS